MIPKVKLVVLLPADVAVGPCHDEPQFPRPFPLLLVPGPKDPFLEVLYAFLKIQLPSSRDHGHEDIPRVPLLAVVPGRILSVRNEVETAPMSDPEEDGQEGPDDFIQDQRHYRERQEETEDGRREGEGQQDLGPHSNRMTPTRLGDRTTKSGTSN